MQLQDWEHSHTASTEYCSNPHRSRSLLTSVHLRRYYNTLLYTSQYTSICFINKHIVQVIQKLPMIYCDILHILHHLEVEWSCPSAPGTCYLLAYKRPILSPECFLSPGWCFPCRLSRLGCHRPKSQLLSFIQNWRVLAWNLSHLGLFVVGARWQGEPPMVHRFIQMIEL